MNVRYVALLAFLDSACSDPMPEVRINEVSAANTTGCPDPFGEIGDWIELINTTSSIIDLGGYRLFDDAAEQAMIPDGVTIGPRGYLLLWADDDNQGLDHLPFKLGASGDSISLEDPAGVVLDEVSWASADPDTSYARIPDAVGDFVRSVSPTCGASNEVGR